MLTYRESKLWSYDISQLKSLNVLTKLVLFTSMQTMSVCIEGQLYIGKTESELTQYSLKSFKSYGTKIWNTLPTSYKADIPLNEF